VLNALRRILEDDYDITMTTDPQQALALLRQSQDFDLVLCDMMMPGLTGAELHDAVAGFSPHLADRMVFATGSTTTPHTRGFLSRVPNLRIEKPIRPAALRELVAAMLAVHARR
jgi:CheY-like chemotaxis protein